MKYLFCTAVFYLSSVFPLHAKAGLNLQESFENTKSELTTVDQKSRDVMSNLYEINTQMKTASKKRSILDNKFLSTQNSVKKIAAEATSLDETLRGQRKKLSQRLRAIYKLGDESVVRAIFSAASSKDLDETLYFLKIISDHDFNLIKSYAKNLNKLQNKKNSLDKEVRRLITAKDHLKQQEAALARQQEKKAEILEGLKAKRESALEQIASLRNLAQKYEITSLLDLSFYENKGKYNLPVRGQVVQGYGIAEDNDFGFILNHKGLRIHSVQNQKVQAVHKGMVSFVGMVPGHGHTVVIDHGDHYYTVYAKLAKPLVTEGQAVRESDEIGLFENQMYFELRHFSDALNPKGWFVKI